MAKKKQGENVFRELLNSALGRAELLWRREHSGSPHRGVTMVDARRLIDALVAQLVRQAVKTGRAEWPNVGVLRWKRRAPKRVVDPDGVEHHIPAEYSLRFSVSKRLQAQARGVR